MWRLTLLYLFVSLVPTPGQDSIKFIFRFRPHRVTFWLNTRLNPTTDQELQIGNLQLFNESNFDVSKELVVIIHGWRAGRFSDLNDVIKKAYLVKHDVNVINVHWRLLAFNAYHIATRIVPKVALMVADLLNFIDYLGLPYSKMHLIGHSLGAHTAGMAGRKCEGLVQRITGLDPAGPIWGKRGDHLTYTDAKYVEVIHTNTGLSGILRPIGHVDFYPNGGKWMNGCGYNLVCCHSRSYYYFAESLLSSDFVGQRCESVREAKRGLCDGTNTLYMGGTDLNKVGQGIYYLETNAQPPYATGGMGKYWNGLVSEFWNNFMTFSSDEMFDYEIEDF